MKVTPIELMVGIFVTVLGFSHHWIVGIVILLVVVIINRITHRLTKDDVSTRVDE